MADVKTCDSCGKSPANRVEVAVVLFGVVTPDGPTGTSLACDACESCQEPAIKVLAEQAMIMLREQVPLHQAMSVAARERDAVQAELNALAPELKHYDTVERAEKMPVELRARRDTLIGQASEAEARRVAAFEEGRKTGEARNAAVQVALKA